MRQPIGVTLIKPSNVAAVGIYLDASGVDIFVSDTPYLSSDGTTLIAPLPVFVADGSMYVDDDGIAHASMAVTSLPDGTEPEPETPTNAVTHNGEVVTHNGEIVTHTE